MPTLYYAAQYASTVLAVAGGINSTQTTGIVLQSIPSQVDVTKPGIVCLSWSNPLDVDKAEYITYTSINPTTKELQGVTRGKEGFSAKSHPNGVTVAWIVSASHINSWADVFEEEHNLSGTHKNITASSVTTTGDATVGGTVKADTIAEKTANNGVTIDGLKIKDSQIPVVTPLYTATDGPTITFDLAVSRNQIVTLGGNRTLALSNVSTGMVFIIHLKQDATGGRTVTWWSGISWADGSAPILTKTANKTDTFGFICTGTNTYYGYIVGQNL
ncbi:MAG: hypothetical protein QXY47_05515 [Thermoplasmata archaeon]